MADVYRHPWSSPTTVRTVDGVPQCPCHQQPMVEHGDKWRCPLNAEYAAAVDALMSKLNAAMSATEQRLGIVPSEEDNRG